MPIHRLSWWNPAGRVSGRIDRRLLFAVSAAVLVAADLLLATATGAASLIGGIVLKGLSLGLSQGLLAARRGTAFGLFNLISGIALLVSSVGAGELWDRVGAPATFYAGAGFAGLALLGLLQRIHAFLGL